jgi:hypothetical protein
MTHERKNDQPRIENLDQNEAGELTPEEAEEAQGGYVINWQPSTDQAYVIDWRSPSLAPGLSNPNEVPATNPSND